ncbi:unnamed protein product [Anisakis simplex]|uniref:Secreted protein n=1 Tax=Anisakis simplex TaxID=6269 RepID=A0A0M3JXT4_ANISI|nr:unnamed protein product [Anisakis simplex]
MDMNYAASTSHPYFNVTSTMTHKQGAFDMDNKALFRSAIVIAAVTCSIAVWAIIKLYRRRSRNRIRRYDLLSVKQLAPELVADSESSEDELFESSTMDDANRRLVSGSRQ